MPILTPNADQLAAARTLLTAAQQNPRTACASLGTDPAGIKAELEGMSPTWTHTARVAVRGEDVVGVVVVDSDEETGRSFIHGPWTTDEKAWKQWARPLIDAAIEQTSPGIDDHEISADPANTRIAALAHTLGWHRSAVNVAYVIRSDRAWPLPDGAATSGVPRHATSADLPAIAKLHTAAFPGSYATARQLVEDDERVTLVLAHDTGPEILGYASAEVQADGAGYLDFIAIAPQSRGNGLSKVLLAAIGRMILTASDTGSLSLTVKAENAPAIALYESFGFTRDGVLVGYRSAPYHE
ncbi:GNAT family N-acetyltransferase [Glaciibacter psychrotolerans]|uniref:Ribosomal protein S18 acetylase RimI-like enzyme n=1 Tax=Glaciibacter psychrotolerans TaxID=670054 RepID=A0A7Z0ECT0_9MICO|nr:N-acetyltransferase [Leifsonia psychrotolerans]NYJ18557.1 ribosomal protein S18 acetylase RimI-like enzyme [Leifsonia psychrotolerans]